MSSGPVSARSTPRHRLRLRSVLGALGLALAVTAGNVAVASPSDDVKTASIKAAFVYNFAKFATWPGTRPRSASDQVCLCVQRGDLDLRALHALEDKHIGERPVRVEIIDPGQPIGACHIYFASGFASDSALRDVLAEARRNAVLLVSDMPGFASLGGHIGLVEDRNRLRFQVNLHAVTQTGVKLSSKLLQLAEIVGAVRE